MLAGVAGGLHAVALRGIGQSTYPASMSLLVFSMAVIGGVSSIGGTLAGVALVQWAGYLFPKAQLLLTGVGLLRHPAGHPGRTRPGVRAGAATGSCGWWPAATASIEHDEVETVELAVEPGHAGRSTATRRAPA